MLAITDGASIALLFGLEFVLVLAALSFVARQIGDLAARSTAVKVPLDRYR